MKTMKTFLIAIFTVLTTLSFSQNLEFEIKGDTLVEITIDECPYNEGCELIVLGEVSNIDTFYVKIINESDGDISSDSFDEDDWYIDEGKLSNGDATIFEKNNLDEIVIYYEIGITITINFDDLEQTLGLKENTQTVFSLYPNPTTDFLNIKGDNVETVKVFNTSGQMVLSESYTHNKAELQLNVSTLPKGVYTLRVNETEPVRFVKE